MVSLCDDTCIIFVSCGFAPSARFALITFALITIAFSCFCNYAIFSVHVNHSVLQHMQYFETVYAVCD